MCSVSDNHTVWFICAPLCLIPTLVAMNIKSVNRQYTQPRHWTRSGEGAIPRSLSTIWRSCTCLWSSRRVGTGQLEPSAALSPGTMCVSHSPKVHDQNIKRSIQTSLTESDRQWHCTLFSPDLVTKCLTLLGSLFDDKCSCPALWH